MAINQISIPPATTLEDLRKNVEQRINKLVLQLNRQQVITPFDVNHNRIVNVAWPVSPDDAVPVNYLQKALANLGIKGAAGVGGFGVIFWRTLDIKDTTVGNDIADRVIIQQQGIAFRVVGVLRKIITADLTLRIKDNGVAIMTCTIPHTTSVGTVVTFTNFNNTPQNLADKDVLSWDITASDGSSDIDGIASFTIQWS